MWTELWAQVKSSAWCLTPRSPGWTPGPVSSLVNGSHPHRPQLVRRPVPAQAEPFPRAPDKLAASVAMSGNVTRVPFPLAYGLSLGAGRGKHSGAS